MKKVSFFILVWLFVSISSFVLAESPIEVIYWKPLDVEMPSQDEIDFFIDVMIEVQSFFASELERYGFGPKTFDFNPKIRIIKGKLQRKEYNPGPIVLHRENPSILKHGLDNQIYVVFLGGDGPISRGSASSQKLCANIPEQLKYCNNLVVVPAENKRLLEVLLAHEIGHAFNIDHHPPNRLILNRIDIMYFPLHAIRGVKEYLKDYALNHQDATFLDEDGRLFIQKPFEDSKQAMDADVNKDGYVDLSDVMIVRSAIQHPNSYDTDLNNDGITDEVDVLIVKAKAVEAIAAASPMLRRRGLKLSTWGRMKERY